MVRGKIMYVLWLMMQMQTGKMQGNQQDQHNRRRANRVLQQCVLRPDVGGFYLCEHAVYLSYPVCSQMFSL